jgi:hypothetical protein
MDSGSALRPAEAALEEDFMISQSCDFDEFMDGIRDLDYLQVIYLADKEATEAERLKYRSRAGRTPCSETCVDYADALKGFIRYMRYGVKSPSMEDSLRGGLQAFREAALENYVEGAEVVEGSEDEE